MDSMLDVGRVEGKVKYIRFVCTCGNHIQVESNDEEYQNGFDYVCECGRTYEVKKKEII